MDQAIAARSDVAGSVTTTEIEALPEGQLEAISTFAVAGDVDVFEDTMREGRLFAAPGEAVAGQGLLDLLGLDVGDDLRLTVDGRPLTLQIVGRYLEPKHDGRIAMYSLETLRQQVDPQAAPGGYGLQLAKGTDPEALKTALLQESNDQIEVTLSGDESIADDVREIRLILLGLDGVLVLVGLVNLLTTTLLSVRERFREFGVLKTLGLTPWQVVASVVLGMSVLALLAVVVGVPLGLAVTSGLFLVIGVETGFGPEFGAMPPWAWLVALAPASVLLAGLGSAIAARLAAGVRIAEVLRSE